MLFCESIKVSVGGRAKVGKFTDPKNDISTGNNKDGYIPKYDSGLQP